MIVKEKKDKPHLMRKAGWGILLPVFIFLVNASYGQGASQFEISALKRLSIEELVNLDVTSVSRRPEKLAEVASAIQVISYEDIQRSGATSIPEALRLATNLQVIQANSYAWLISARGFNSVFSNKLLVLIDGRTVYSPLFGGVFWDAQNILLENVDRIEIISGPGGTLWGANAVNGIINIVTKKSQDSKGLFASVLGGSNMLQAGANARYGGTIGKNLTYRISGQHLRRGHTIMPADTANRDANYISYGSIRLDWTPNEDDIITMQSNMYGGVEESVSKNSILDGQNILGRWSHNFSETSDLILQLYFDRTWRRAYPSMISDQLNTYDAEFHHHLALGSNNHLIWGGGLRFMQNQTTNGSPIVGFVPQNRDMTLSSVFVQNQMDIFSEILQLTTGIRLLHNVFSGFEWQPSVRFSLTPAERHNIWGAISHAVRAPSRIDVDYRIPTYEVPPGTPHVAGGPNFTSEKVVALELGYRVQPNSKSAISLAPFYNVYDDLYSVEALEDGTTYQIMNGVKGTSWGAELNGNAQLIKGWRMRGGFTYFNKELEYKPGHDSYDFRSLGNDAKYQALIQSIVDFPLNIQFDIVARYVGGLEPNQFSIETDSYFAFDARVAWVYKAIEVAFIGQNLPHAHHVEFNGVKIPRSAYLKVALRI